MNKKAIATDAISIISVLLFTIFITTGTLFWLNFENVAKYSIESKAETINQGITLRNYLRTPVTGEKNVAEFIINSIDKPNNQQLLEQYTQNIKPFFWEIQLIDGDKTLLTIKGDQNESSKKKQIIQEQEIPNYITGTPKYYIIRMIGEKIDADLVMHIK
tara:strand:+ start:460 stop:939 length:480 start_codon:yes stop_codon:yes gene_type:complete